MWVPCRRHLLLVARDGALGLADGGGAAALGLLALGLGLLLALHQQLGVVGGSLLGGSLALLLQRNATVLALQHNGGDQALDLGGLGGGLLVVLGGQRATHHKATHIILLPQVEQLADLAGTLGSQATWDGGVGEAGDVLLALLQYNQSQHGHVGVHDASAHGLALALASAAWAVARVSLLQEQTHTTCGLVNV